MNTNGTANVASPGTATTHSYTPYDRIIHLDTDDPREPSVEWPELNAPDSINRFFDVSKINRQDLSGIRSVEVFEGE